MKDYTDFIDFAVGLASGEFDADHLYRMGYPTKYNLEKQDKELIKGRVVVEAHGLLPVDISSIPIMQVGISPEDYGSGKAYIPPAEASPLLTDFFREKIDLKRFFREFADSITCAAAQHYDTPLLERLATSGANITVRLMGNAVIVAVEPDNKPLGYAVVAYENNGNEENHVPEDVGDLVCVH
ncbi:hypothetical protein KY331_01725 [Candidatus Woesearchaeota archaeon]|nr:hypothetical protein [Candidatus Woesearchaeota archaeon]